MKHDSVVVLVLRKASSMLGFTWLRKTYQFFLPHKKRCSNTHCKYLYRFYLKIDAFLIFCENIFLILCIFSSSAWYQKIITPWILSSENEKRFWNIYYTLLFVEWHFNFLQRLMCFLKRILLNQITHLNREIGNISK